jgi:hypothetical protein
MKQFPRFFLLTLAVAMALIASAAALNITVDPYYAFGNNSHGLFLRSERPFKEQRVTEFQRDGMIIGNSKMAYINSGQFADANFFNASFSGALPEEILSFLNKHAKRSEVVIIGFDFWSFSKSVPYISKSHFQKSQQLLFMEYALTLDGFVDSLRTMSFARNGEPEVYLNNGSRNLTGKYASHTSTMPEALRKEQRKNSKFFSFRKLDGFRLSAKRLDAMRRLRQLLTERNIGFTVILMPVPDVMVVELEKLGLRSLYDDWRKQMKDIFGNVLDYSESYTELDYYFADGVHFIPTIGRKILRASLDAASGSAGLSKAKVGS